MTKAGRKALRWLLALALLPVIFFIVALALHPYLSVTDPSGADVAVVEGWIPAVMMPAVKEEIERRGYRKIYTTGTIRPFSYWLKEHGSITVELPEPMEGGVRIIAAGLPGAEFMVIADTDTVATRRVGGGLGEYWIQLLNPVQRLRIQAIGEGPDDVDLIFLKELTIRGRNAHELHRSIMVGHADGSTLEGWPTYAHHAENRLRELGVEAGSIMPVPAEEIDRGRTAGNAEAFAMKAAADGVIAFDVISMGVHARRSRKEFQKACGNAVEVGVISLPDPYAPPGRWWRERIGWIRLLKELAGLPMTGLMAG